MDFATYDLDDKPSPWRRRGLRVLISIALLAMIGLALWPPEIDVQRPDPENGAEAAKSCGRKLGTLAMAVATSHTIERQLSEIEINAHLDRLIGQNESAQQSQGFTLGLTDLDIDLETDAATLYVTGRMLIVPVIFEARFTGQHGEARVVGQQPTDPGEATLRLRSLRIGHLPLLGPIKALVASQMAGLIAKLPTESTVLRYADTFNFADDQVAVVVEGTVEGDMVLPSG